MSDETPYTPPPKKFGRLGSTRLPKPLAKRLGGPKSLEWMEKPNSMRAAFVREYLIDMSPTNAAIRAGYTPARAQEIGATLMKMPMVADAVKRALASRAKRVNLNADRVLDMLGRMALGNPKSVFHEDGSLKAPHELDDDDAMLIAGVKTRRIVEINPDTGKMHNAEIQEVKLIDRTAVIALAMRHLGMMNDKLTIETGGTLAEQLEAAMARRDGGEEKLTEDGLAASDIAALEHEERLLVEDADYEEVESEAMADVPDEWKAML